MTGSRTVTVALVGNPNCGKTALFNRLTGTRSSVGNYPRVTIAKNECEITHGRWTIRLVDLPGIYSMTSQSPEERIGREFIQNEQPDIVLNVLDAGNLDRNLFLTTQLIEMGRPRIYDLNMVDETRAKGITFAIDDLSTMLGGKIIETVGLTGEGLDVLLDAIVETAEEHRDEIPMRISYDNHLEDAITRVQKLVAALHPKSLNEMQTRWLSIKLLEGDEEIVRQEEDHEHLIEMVRRERYDMKKSHGEDTEAMFANARYGFIHGLLAEVRTVAPDPLRRLDVTRRIDSVLLHRVLGMPIFLVLMWVMFHLIATQQEMEIFALNKLTAGVQAITASATAKTQRIKRTALVKEPTVTVG